MLNSTERSMIQLQFITPTTPDELIEAMKRNQEMYNKAWMMLRQAVEKHQKEKQLKIRGVWKIV